MIVLPDGILFILYTPLYASFSSRMYQCFYVLCLLLLQVGLLYMITPYEFLLKKRSLHLSTQLHLCVVGSYETVTFIIHIGSILNQISVPVIDTL